MLITILNILYQDVKTIKLRHFRFGGRSVENLFTLAITSAFIVIFLTVVIFREINEEYAFVNKKVIEKTDSEIASSTEIIAEDNVNLININTATIEELITLSGIGEVTAQKIIDYRENNNGFLYIEELLEVNGIGQAKLDKIRDYITVG